MAKTRADLVNKALGNLGATSVGQAVDAESFEIVDGYIETIFASLAAREIIYVADPSSIPEEVFLQVALCLADAAKTEFGIAADESDNLHKKVKGDPAVPGDKGAEGELREMVRGKATYERQRAEYF